ncbi:glutaredoxin 2 [Tatumella sp. TA1]|uniref:glutaredoxin 2 n=1 Tax=Rosenbergiella collisarenosi TaxID=1544695 RepID=UPI0008F7EAB6|nr:glutaredoxin 2 [Rosenbergiella collisarenosi]MBT0721152.1 glutaredoxin 2 [Rosenbergiella collisarenosi]QGX91170.1 glutaredoxin 2 [Tatumella sp. TA1]
MHLYVYDHCPFCVKARMIFGLHQQPVELSFLLNDDEATPQRLIGKKMLPILVKDDQSAMGESLDIIDYIESRSTLPRLSTTTSPALAEWLTEVGSYVNQLLLPIMPTTDFAEFATDAARDYYAAKKQAFMGDFGPLRAQRTELVLKVNQDLERLAEIISSPHAVNGTLSYDDIHLFPLLRNLTLVKEIVWPDSVAALRDSLSRQTAVPLLFSLAR